MQGNNLENIKTSIKYYIKQYKNKIFIFIRIISLFFILPFIFNKIFYFPVLYTQYNISVNKINNEIYDFSDNTNYNKVFRFMDIFRIDKYSLELSAQQTMYYGLKTEITDKNLIKVNKTQTQPYCSDESLGTGFLTAIINIYSSNYKPIVKTYSHLNREDISNNINNFILDIPKGDDKYYCVSVSIFPENKLLTYISIYLLFVTMSYLFTKAIFNIYVFIKNGDI